MPTQETLPVTMNVTVTIPDPIAGPQGPMGPMGPAGVAGSSPQWAWNQGYLQPNGTTITVPPGFSGSLAMPTGSPFPPGYKVSDGSTPGGVYPTGTVNGQPIIIMPPVSGTGPVKFKVDLDMFLFGASSFTCYFGVAYPSGPAPANQPMWPWLGVGHVLPPLPACQIPSGGMWYHCQRLDVLDGVNFNGPGGVPSNWPAWAVQTNSNNLLYPGLCLTFTNPGANPITITGLIINATAE